MNKKGKKRIQSAFLVAVAALSLATALSGCASGDAGARSQDATPEKQPITTGE
ncbi:conserved hypothetical protein [Paenibacillus curdlanolyticus YK9]|uniref:ABC transporter substrate-binding protein n=1 Tax=Paenibacillus curdlanolyticus YK9 TaxID=717606 RepID=E0IG64_9BACL|nr:hypothetical protein [Paenibacillus curdlanolyticus]EFM08644.1 conserved hypothetical protein [Paenibacillus curdlanolyticus YK9]